jgi:hypothetical protein
MATEKDIQNKDNVTSRRGFMAAMGFAAAATAVRASPVPGRTSWAGIGGAIEALRAAYLAEVERFALELESRFRAGELRAEDEAIDVYDYDSPETWHERCPQAKLERLVAQRFGLEVKKTTYVSRCGDSEHEYETFDGDTAAAYLILAVSPHGDAVGSESYHPAYDARSCVVWDVIALARARRWYVPSDTECGDPIADNEEIERLRRAGEV